METVQLVDWIRSGSLLAFAGAVLWELRQQRNERNQQNKMLTALLNDLNSAMAILLDRSGVKRRSLTPALGNEKIDDGKGEP